jgi:hypothetical protein
MKQNQNQSKCTPDEKSTQKCSKHTIYLLYIYLYIYIHFDSRKMIPIKSHTK